MRRRSRPDDDTSGYDSVGADYDRMSLADLERGERGERDPYAEVGADYDGGPRQAGPLRKHAGRGRLARRFRRGDNRPTKRPRWDRAPVDCDTVLQWARNARDQAARAHAFARDFRAALEKKERGRLPSLVLLRARSLSDQALRSRVAKKGRCRALCGAALEDGARSPYCGTCRPLVRADRSRIRGLVFQAAHPAVHDRTSGAGTPAP